MSSQPAARRTRRAPVAPSPLPRSPRPGEPTPLPPSSRAPGAPPPLPRPLQPLRRSRPRKTLRLRPGGEADLAACAALDAAYTTEYIWQLDTRTEPDEWRTSFRLVRLPRSLTLSTEHRPPASARGGRSRTDQLWLVAEEVEEEECALREQEAEPPEPLLAPGGASWSHELRRTGGTSVMQLSLPPASYITRAVATPASPRAAANGASGSPASVAQEHDRGTSAKVVGYVVAVASPPAAAQLPPSRHAYLRTLVVDRSYRRRGIAARLLAETLRWAASLGAEDVMADVPARNYPALRLLQKAGFTFCGFNDRCYDDGEVALFLSARLR